MRDTPPTPRRVRTAHESKSASVRAAAAAPSRRQQSKWQREQQQQRMLFVAVGVLVVLVAAIFAGGVLYDNFVRANQVIAQVGPQGITTSQLLDQVRPQVRALDAQAKQIGSGANITSYVDQQKRSMPDQVLNDMIDNRLIKQEADRRGISVSASDVDDKERQTVATFQASNNPAPTPEPSPAAEAAATPAAATIPGALAAPTTPPTPTAVPTLEKSAYDQALQDLLTRNGLTETEFRTQLEQSLLRDKMQTVIIEAVPQTQEQVHARQIEVEDQDQANTILTQLQGGADFGSLVTQFSLDTTSKANGGDLGWFARGSSGKTKQFDDVVFGLQPGQLSDVFEDTDGWHIVQTLERDPARELPADQLTSGRQKAFDDWLSAHRSQDVKLQFSPSDKDWILSRIGLRP